eukprot:COSAG05_NODE_1389_length_5003_cov_4.929853_2_plen_603_part_00
MSLCRREWSVEPPRPVDEWRAIVHQGKLCAMAQAHPDIHLPQLFDGSAAVATPRVKAAVCAAQACVARLTDSDWDNLSFDWDLPVLLHVAVRRQPSLAPPSTPMPRAKMMAAAEGEPEPESQAESEPELQHLPVSPVRNLSLELAPAAAAAPSDDDDPQRELERQRRWQQQELTIIDCRPTLVDILASDSSGSHWQQKRLLHELHVVDNIDAAHDSSNGGSVTGMAAGHRGTSRKHKLLAPPGWCGLLVPTKRWMQSDGAFADTEASPPAEEPTTATIPVYVRRPMREDEPFSHTGASACAAPEEADQEGGLELPETFECLVAGSGRHMLAHAMGEDATVGGETGALSVASDGGEGAALQTSASTPRAVRAQQKQDGRLMRHENSDSSRSLFSGSETPPPERGHRRGILHLEPLDAPHTQTQTLASDEGSGEGSASSYGLMRFKSVASGGCRSAGNWQFHEDFGDGMMDGRFLLQSSFAKRLLRDARSTVTTPRGTPTRGRMGSGSWPSYGATVASGDEWDTDDDNALLRESSGLPPHHRRGRSASSPPPGFLIPSPPDAPDDNFSLGMGLASQLARDKMSTANPPHISPRFAAVGGVLCER